MDSTIQISHLDTLLPIAIVFIVIGIPVLCAFIFAGYKLKKRHEFMQKSDELLLEMTKNGQQLTPELIAAIRTHVDEDQHGDKRSQDDIWAANKILLGVAFIAIGILMAIFKQEADFLWLLFPGFLIAAPGAGYYLGLYTSRKKTDEDLSI